MPGDWRRDVKDNSSLEALGHTKREELQRRAARGEQAVRHGAAEHRHPLWERMLGWLLIAAFIVSGAWFAVWGYQVMTGDPDSGEPNGTQEQR